MFQYLQEKTSRINEIWNREGRMSELDLRDFDPKKLQKDLITDPEEKADWEILEEAEKVESQVIYFENRLQSIQDAQHSITQLKEDRPKVIRYLNEISAKRMETRRQEGIAAYNEKRDAIIEKHADEEDKMAAELSKLKKGRYDYVNDPEGKFKAEPFDGKTDEELYAECKKAVEVLDKLMYRDSDEWGDIYYNRSTIMDILTRFRGNFKDYKQLVERVLIPLGLSVDTLDNPVQQVSAKVAGLREQLEKIGESRAERVMKYKRELESNKFAVTVADRVNEFSKYNYLLDALFPEAILPKVTMDDKLKQLLGMMEKRMELGGPIIAEEGQRQTDAIETSLFETIDN